MVVIDAEERSFLASLQEFSLSHVGVKSPLEDLRASQLSQEDLVLSHCHCSAASSRKAPVLNQGSPARYAPCAST